MRGMFNPELGPVGKADVTARNTHTIVPTWTPAFAGEARKEVSRTSAWKPQTPCIACLNVSSMNSAGRTIWSVTLTII